MLRKDGTPSSEAQESLSGVFSVVKLHGRKKREDGESSYKFLVYSNCFMEVFLKIKLCKKAS